MVHQCKLIISQAFFILNIHLLEVGHSFMSLRALSELITCFSVSPLIRTCKAFKVWNPIPVNFIDSFHRLLISYANSCLFEKEKNKNSPFAENAFLKSGKSYHILIQLWAIQYLNHSLETQIGFNPFQNTAKMSSDNLTSPWKWGNTEIMITEIPCHITHPYSLRLPDYLSGPLTEFT